MKNTIILISVFTFLNVMLGVSGCDNSGQWEQEQADLLRQTAELEQRHCLLKASVDSLWDVTSAQLARVFPPNFPSIDRDIFIKARNADHIRMFMSFKQLDAKAQLLVNQAGEQDKILAAKIQNLLVEKQGFERQKNQFLQQVEQKDEAVSKAYAHQLRTAATQVCESAPNHSLK